MNTNIDIKFDPKTKRLIFNVPWHLNDVIRSFPAKRFDPKSKTWRVPIVAGNIRHIDSIKHLYPFNFNEDAQHAVKNFEALNSGPVYQPFPDHLYDFKLSQSGYVPMQHQTKMLDKVWNLPAAAWFAKMGTGKTFAAIHLMFARFKAGLIDGVIISCPSTLRATWRKELAKYATGEYDFRIHETKASWLKEFYAQKSDPKKPVLQILAVSVEGLGVSEQLYDSVCGFFPNRRIFLVQDESSRIKSPKALRTQRSISLGACSTYRLILNGTPIALGIQDLWSQYEFLDPNIIGMGDYWAFKTKYVVMGGYEMKQIVGYQNVEELMKLIEPYTVEVGKDVLNLPPKVPKQRYVNATPEQKKLLKIIKKGGSDDPNDPIIKVDNALERVLRWRQVVGGWLPRSVPEELPNGEIVWNTVLEPLAKNPKMDDLFNMIEDHNAGSKFIIWTPFVHEIEYIIARLAKVYGPDSVRAYYGKTDKSLRSDIEDAYCNDPSMRYFVGNAASAGLGLTLISGESDIMVYYSGTNAYIDRAQSEDRAHRIGQHNSVVVADIIMERTVDESIAASIALKMNVEEYIMERLAKGEPLQFEG